MEYKDMLSDTRQIIDSQQIILGVKASLKEPSMILLICFLESNKENTYEERNIIIFRLPII